MIQNIIKKLNGEIPITRKELIEFVNSWGRDQSNFVYYEDDLFKQIFPKECYPLNKLDVSKIDDLSYIFINSLFNGDISNWNVSNCINMIKMFSKSKFDGDISKWNFNDYIHCEYMFYNNKNFINKYNNKKEISINSKEIINWINQNKETIRELNQGTKEEILDFFSFPCFSEQVM